MQSAPVARKGPKLHLLAALDGKPNPENRTKPQISWQRIVRNGAQFIAGFRPASDRRDNERKADLY
jgi:hypothetical protein